MRKFWWRITNLWTLCNLAFVLKLHNLKEQILCLKDIARKITQNVRFAIFLPIHDPMKKSINKDILYPRHVCSVIYNYKCLCNSEYIGRTNQRLETRIDHHMPAKICGGGQCENLHRLVNTFASVIAKHLINNPICLMFLRAFFHQNQRSTFRLPSDNSWNHLDKVKAAVPLHLEELSTGSKCCLPVIYTADSFELFSPIPIF